MAVWLGLHSCGGNGHPGKFTGPGGTTDRQAQGPSGSGRPPAAASADGHEKSLIDCIIQK
jgi:hypothetical protein